MAAGRAAGKTTDEKMAPTIKEQKATTQLQNCCFLAFPEPTLMILHKMASRSSPVSLRGAAGVHSGRPKRAPRDAKGAPRRPQEPPRAPQKLPRGIPRAALAGTWGRPGPKEPPGGLQEAIFAPSGIDCWLLRGSIWVAPSAFWGALSTATKYRAYSPNWRPRRPGPRTAHRTPRTPPRMGSAAGA